MFQVEMGIEMSNNYSTVMAIATTNPLANPLVSRVKQNQGRSSHQTVDLMQPNFNKMNRILIVEDQPRIAAFLEKGLRQAGFITTVAQDGWEAWHLTSNEPFDLIILDLMLPDRHGFDVLQDLRHEGYHLPIMILTASDSLQNRELGFQYGANDYLMKPFKFSDLLERVRALL
ncbi:response regulator transcription factor [Oculatella sp. LEGE 06141]|uniref:response regulator transcription factor n=1 Tax=Oculatella sp. LEGE 06141 TaxID=1828648 RepID=UPI001D135A69|nr:response regulator [Oculatella sp. LEGE 06141]